jgi:hypothetical protein
MKTRYFLVAVLWWHNWRRAWWTGIHLLARTMRDYHNEHCVTIREKLWPTPPMTDEEFRESMTGVTNLMRGKRH